MQDLHRLAPRGRTCVPDWSPRRAAHAGDPVRHRAPGSPCARNARREQRLLDFFCNCSFLRERRRAGGPREESQLRVLQPARPPVRAGGGGGGIPPKGAKKDKDKAAGAPKDLTGKHGEKTPAQLQADEDAKSLRRQARALGVISARSSPKQRMMHMDFRKTQPGMALSKSVT